MTGSLLAIAWKTKPRQPMITADRATISVDFGIAGDWRGAAPNRQVSVLFQADWAAACAELDAELEWTLRRANLLVGGVGNPERVGGRLQVGDVVLAITDECDPCSRMDAQYNGLRRALTPYWRGGLLATVISGGEIAVGDPVRWAPPAAD